MSTSTKRVYDVIVAPGETKIDCHSANLIYLLTCDNCATQYVGETVCQLSERMSHHLSSIKDSINGVSSCKHFATHFNVGLCKGSKFTIRILEKLEGNSRVGSKKRDPIDGTSKRLRLAREKHWMLKLRTVFPFGLNEKVGDEWKQDDSIPISSKFPKLHRSLRVT